MYLLAWIFIGAVVGWGTGRIFEGNGYGPFMDTLMGIGGGLLGGVLMRSAAFGGYRGTIVTTMVALMGGVLLTLLAALVNGRRVYASQLQESRHTHAGSHHVQPVPPIPDTSQISNV